MQILKPFLFLLPCTLLACALDPSEEGQALDDGDETSTTAQAVTWTSLTPFYQTQTTGDVNCDFRECVKDLGPSNDRTCFLAGIKGSLGLGSQFYPAGANVNIQGTRWKLVMLNPEGGGLGARAVCIANTLHRTTAIWQSTGGSLIIPAGTTNRRCFLGGVYNYNHASFNAFDSSVYVRRNANNSHTIGGTLPAGDDVRVFATCVDLSGDYSSGDWGNGTASTVSSVLAHNQPGVACGLQGISGIVQALPSGTLRGLDIDYVNTDWKWTLSPWTGAKALCSQ